MFNLIVTGSTGFVGTNFIESSSNLNIQTVDLLVKNPVDINFDAIDSVLHLAALVHQMKGAPEHEYFKVNRDLAFEVAKRAKEQGVKQFVFMSTAKVYGESDYKITYYNENSACMPSDPYGKSKYEAEKLISSLEDENFKAAIVRSPLVYGPGVKGNMISLIRLIDKFRILPFNKIDNKRSMVYIGNLVALLNTIIERQASGIFIAGDNAPVSTTELVSLIAKELKKPYYLFKLPKPFLKTLELVKPELVNRLFGSLVLDSTNTFHTLNFTPPYSTKEGIAEMIKWYKSQYI